MLWIDRVVDNYEKFYIIKVTLGTSLKRCSGRYLLLCRLFYFSVCLKQSITSIKTATCLSVSPLMEMEEVSSIPRR